MVGSLISIVEGRSLCFDFGFCKGSFAGSKSVSDSDV